MTQNKWRRLNDYAITNGEQFIANQGCDNEYKHGAHIISKAMIGNKCRYTLWEGDKKLGFFDSSQEAMRYINEQ